MEIFHRRKDSDYGHPDNFALGPKIGFLKSWHTAYRAQQLAASLRGLEFGFEEADERQVTAWGGQNVPRLGNIADYAEIARYYEGELTVSPAREAALAERLKGYDEAVEQARAHGREVVTAREL